jgi:putative transposase
LVASLPRPVRATYDNALAETTIGLFKTEKIRREGPWRTLADVELATLEWVDWFNTIRLQSACGQTLPAQFEQRYRQSSNPIATGSNEPRGRFMVSSSSGLVCLTDVR